MAERIMRSLTHAMNRRTFLIRVVVGTTAGAATMMGLSSTAAAATCCVLCNSPGGCNYACSWCWDCCDYSVPTPVRWRCCEGYASSGSNCTAGSCPALCSWQQTVSGPC